MRQAVVSLSNRRYPMSFLALGVMALSLSIPTASGFSAAGQSRRYPATTALRNDLFEDVSVPIRTSDLADAGTTPSTETLTDTNGQEFTVGAIVRVCSKGLKQFQITPKGHGYFDDNGQFVAATGPGKPHLKIPVGLRGTITKVYDETVLSANFPIQVSFIPGQNTEDGLDPPVRFLMHFAVTEVECV